MHPRSTSPARAPTRPPAPDTAPGAGLRIAEALVQRLAVQLQLSEAECATAPAGLAADIALLRRRVLVERLAMARAVLTRAAAARDAWLCEPDPRRPPPPPRR
jgi:hypothetical protein